MTNATRLTAAALVGVIAGLLAVGVVSGTPVRHLVQVVPAMLALALVLRRTDGASYAALPIFVFWLLIMLAIWLFLLGLSRILTGQFSPTEIVLTILIGLSCVLGLSQTLRMPRVASRLSCAMLTVAFAALQIAALWLSLRPAIATI